jgi:DNA-binding transcriptional MerR regulator
MDNDLYSQKALFLRMEEIATRLAKDRQDFFRPLIIAERFLTKSNVGEVLEGWKKSVKELYVELTDKEDKDFICLFFAIMYYKYDYEIETKRRPPIDDFIKETGMDDAVFYRYFYDEDMRRQLQISKNLELLDTKIKSLRKIADADDTKEQNKILAWRDITEHIIKQIKALDGDINIYGGQVAIDASKNKQLSGQVDISKLIGQGTPEFRDRIRELDEIKSMEGKKKSK